ncbi:class I SAM-dependent methyltransferase [Microbacterium sp. ZW CA_36]|uniref:class I SAM-dependent methyltransferase n=1 Tax=Microbacterium sp. ZW CA_36 TaxID=3378078 RepID=UPI0038555D8D
MPQRAPRAADDTFWLRPTSYWLPAHYPVSAWYTHAPFAAWLVDVLRPANVAELGTHMGFSCFAFAEAAARLGHTITISALDSWMGDDQAGFYGEDVLESVRGTAELDYPASVRLVRGFFSDSRPRFADASIDLLHIDGRHAYEDVLQDYEQWRSVVRDGGVILFHDTAERERGFGVWRLWDELRDANPTFTFNHGHGLGVLGVGDVRNDDLRKLFAADDGTADRIRDDFASLGAEVAHRAELDTLPEELRHARLHATQLLDKVAWLEGENEHLRSAVAARDQRIGALESSTSWRVTAPLRAVRRVVPHRGESTPDR